MSAAAPAGPTTVRRATDADLAQVGQVTAHAYVADGLVEADHWYVDELRDTAARAAAATVLVAVAPAVDGAPAERVVGTITLAAPGSPYAEIARDGEVELRMLAVDPAARRSGVAEQLVVAALREAVGRGDRRVVLSTLETMHAAHRLYARLGFVAAPERDWTDELTMRVHAWHAPAAPSARTESATWPPLRVVEVDGWRVGLSGGVTRRASSTLALRDVEDVADTVGRVERLYRDDGAPAVFRVGDPGNPAGLAAVLDARGYAVAAVTDVLVRDLDATVRPADGDPGTLGGGLCVRGTDVPDDGWLDLWLGGKGGAREPSRAIVTGAPARYLTATGADGTAVAVIRAAVVDDWVALSCLQVVPSARRRGIGRALTLHALAAAWEHGARRAFLQVEADNDVACRLYGALGFRPAHRYAYRVQPGHDVRTGC
ncbi:GNAT family N-acetyltransferase [Cellulomonas xiejunii]|uniref:GNAT family N-acetyltransferase n=1 Tax=Cellulomonas xiejunii TaxID=2968083 RepID=A0ABY5KU08_9CELL|nr:GNAT family N-acetyltransferase [Cellulomonas xiejunii]MCC2315231.1 GNAT family N-acetyltransferase [Cellulomonas xiejunii]MCC2321626.1 GNAT family N-acetyltransferase [Cellulomonas xiejunii]UUI72941.1 GNAT family N-acetyltransferase [Cellulomonas xiejunii]